MEQNSIFGRNAGLRALAIAGALLFTAQPAAAAVITSLPDGVRQDFVRNNNPVNAPVRFGDGVTYKATTPQGVQRSSLFGSTDSFVYPDGSNWGNGAPFAAIGLANAIMSFTFDTPVSAVLADFIWGRSDTSRFTFRAFDTAGQLLESVSFTGVDPAHPKGFYGLQYDRNQIARFEVEGYYFGVRNLSTLVSETAAVPEPATWAMMILGFGMAGGVLRTRRRSLSVAA